VVISPAGEALPELGAASVDVVALGTGREPGDAEAPTSETARKPSPTAAADLGAAVERGSSGGGSTGLGLDIARRTAEVSGGRMRISSTTAGIPVTLELGARA
jgi:hypothetical protein